MAPGTRNVKPPTAPKERSPWLPTPPSDTLLGDFARVVQEPRFHAAGTAPMIDDSQREDRWLALRRRMVESQIRSRGVQDERVLQAMIAVPRERFVPPRNREHACEDRALPVDCGQTISQPFIVAYMTEQLAPAPTHRILEIGTGTGYQTAILARLCNHVYSVERIPSLTSAADALLAKLNVMNISLSIGDGTVGLPTAAPFDGIIVTAAGPKVPPSLIAQLAEDGRLIAPVGGASQQTIVRVVRRHGQTTETPLLACRFVKLVGKEGWDTT